MLKSNILPMFAGTLATVLTYIGAPSAQAISIIPGNEAAAEAEADLYRGVGQLSFNGNAFCSGSLVSDSWFLTAKHCSVWVDDFVSFGDDLTLPTENLLGRASVLETFSPGEEDFFLLDGTDIALLRLSTPLSDVIDPIALLNESGNSLVGLEAINVGWGLRGDGTGFVSFDDATNSAAVRNIIDAYGQAVDDDSSLIPGSRNQISMDFDKPGDPSESRTGDDTPIPFEGQVVIGDSGSPALIQTEAGVAIAGVLSGGTTPAGDFGDVSWWTGVKPHFNWINNTIAAATPNECVTWTTLDGELFRPCEDPASVPEPSASVVLLAFGAIGVSKRWAKRLK